MTIVYSNDQKHHIKSKGALIYQAGDSYAVGDAMEKNLAKFLADSIGMDFLSQNDCLRIKASTRIELGKVFSVQQRIETLLEKINMLSAPVVLIGRSSGARVASICAANTSQVAAVIGLAYPFKHPAEPIQQDRYAHLEKISVPTLIIQGVRDEYGGLVANQKYRFSSFVNFFYLNASHGMNLSDRLLNIVRMRSKRFILQVLTVKQ